jgi:hypothetical protein
MKIENIKLSQLKPAPYNPRLLTEEAYSGLKKSIETYGLVEPIIYNEQTGHIVGGHQRYQVLLEQGIEETPVVIVDLSEVDEKALNVTLNNTAIQGEFTDDLQEILYELKETIPQEFEELKLNALVEFDNNYNPEKVENIDETDEGIKSNIKIVCYPKDESEIRQRITEIIDDYKGASIE